MTLILRKLLASSTYAISGTLQGLADKLENLITKQELNNNLFEQNLALDYEVFENFLIQAALIMFSRPPKDMRSHPLPDMLG